MTDTNKRSSGFAQAPFQNLASTVVLSTTTVATTTDTTTTPSSFCHPGGSGGRQRVPRHIHHHLGWSLVTDVIRRTDKRHRRRNQCAKGQVAYVCVQITEYFGHPWANPLGEPPLYPTILAFPRRPGPDFGPAWLPSSLPLLAISVLRNPSKELRPSS